MRHKNPVMLLIGIIIIFFVIWTVNAESSQEWYEKGISDLNQGLYEEAVISFKKALDIDPKNIMAWDKKGTTLFALGKYDESMRAFDQALKIEPNNSVVIQNRDNTKLSYQHINKGISAYKMGDYDEAIKEYDLALDLTPDNILVWGKKAYILIVQKHIDLLESYLPEVQKYFPDENTARSILWINCNESSNNDIGNPFFTNMPSVITIPTQKDCPGITKCGNNCCAPDQGCCYTENGPICYDPYTQVCKRI